MENKAGFWIKLITLSSLLHLLTAFLQDADIQDTPIQMTCNFHNSSMCAWTNDVDNHDLEWIVVNSMHAGGKTDHLDRKNGYFLTTRGTLHVGGNAAIITPVFKNNFTCLSLYVQTSGVNSASLVIYKVVRSLWAPVYRSNFHHFDGWQHLQLTILSPQNYQIAIESRQYNGQEGMIFLDDIQVDFHQCALPRLTYTNVSCDFEDGSRQCNYSIPSWNVSPAGHQWTLVSEDTQLPWKHMASIADHTTHTSSGHCLVSQLYHGGSGNSTTSSVIETPIYDGIGTHCLSFYYLMFAQNTSQQDSIGSLNLYINPVNDTHSHGLGKASALRASWSGGHNRHWVQVHVEYQIHTQYRVIFESVPTNEWTIYAIDDVTIKSDTCPKPTTTTTTAPASSSASPILQNTTIITNYHVTFNANKQTSAKAGVWTIVAGVGGTLVFLVAVVVVFLSQKRKVRQRDYKRTDSNEEGSDYPSPPQSPTTTKAFNNPLTDIENVYFANPGFPTSFEKQGTTEA